MSKEVSTTKGFSRDAFAPAPMNQIEAQDEAINSMIDEGSGKRVYLSITEGENTFRAFPCHPALKNRTFYRAKSVAWLPMEYEYEEEGEKKIKKYKKPIFNARIHGGASKDLVEVFRKMAIDFVKDSIDDKEEQKKKLKEITNWKTGLNIKTSYVGYFKKIAGQQSTYGLMEMPITVKDKTKELAVGAEGDGAITLDPYTHPDTGKAIKITYDKNAKKSSDYYKVALLWQQDWPLSDKELAWLIEQDDLDDLFINAFTSRDLENQITGLALFDKNHDLGIFETQEFQDIVEEMRAIFPEDVDYEAEEVEVEEYNPQSEEQQALPQGESPVVEEAPNPKKKSILDSLSKEELIELVDLAELDILVRRSTTKEKLISAIEEESNGDKKQIKKWVALLDGEEEAIKEAPLVETEEVEQPQEETKEQSQTGEASSGLSALDSFKKKHGLSSEGADDLPY